ncbi:coiled-coil domain-containing protein 117 isoform X2 [Ambystoma mexicanum]|uniref:coiled-coil domain-containing protein 117 isoform X2 n=1 Tax=Ambystoma mexicanum TaxID=8296 RepID=UPI0037E8742A
MMYTGLTESHQAKSGMATLNKSLNRIVQVIRVDFICSAFTLFKRPYPAEIMEHLSQFLTTDIGVNVMATEQPEASQQGNFDVHSNLSLVAFAGDTNSVVPLVALGLFSNTDGMQGIPPESCKKNSPQRAKKHKREYGDYMGDDYPEKKKKRIEEPSVPLLHRGDAWGQCKGGQVVNSVCPCIDKDLSSTSEFEISCEEMEQISCEQQSENARKALQDIEDRLTEEVEIENRFGNIPKLVFSDTLKEELKRDYNGLLTKKMVASWSQPSMELVLWKPLPVFDGDKQNTVPKEFKEAIETDSPNTSAMCAAFQPQIETLFNSSSSNLTCDALPSDWCTDEEMEL